MNLRWLWLDFVPPDVPLTASQRRAVRRAIMAARRGSRSDPWKRLAFAAGFIATHTCVAMAVAAPAMNKPRLAQWDDFAVYAGAGLMIWILVIIMARLMFAGRLPQVLRRMNIGCCIRCGYLLANLPPRVARCPECGAVRLPPVNGPNDS